LPQAEWYREPFVSVTDEGFFYINKKAIYAAAKIFVVAGLKVFKANGGDYARIY
jgi:hypothetical protein